MRFIPCIFLLLTLSVELFSAQKIECKANSYKNDASLLSKLKGYLYTISTSIPYSNNEIFKFNTIVKDNIFVRTTNDAKCCKTMRFATTVKKDRFTYVITNDKDCPTQLTENANMKLISTNADRDGSYCIIVWTCRSSRQGVHAFCSKNKVSENMKKWISGQYKKLRLTEHKVVHNRDYKDAKCFKKQ